jgi:glycerol kinase
LAGLAVGFWTNIQEIAKNWRVDRNFEPEMDHNTREMLYNKWLKAVEATRAFK